VAVHLSLVKGTKWRGGSQGEERKERREAEVGGKYEQRDALAIGTVGRGLGKAFVRKSCIVE